MRIFYDVDTQVDFMCESGALYVPEAELIKDNLAKLTQHAVDKKFPIMGSVDKHFGTDDWKEHELELSRWGGPFPDHCMFNTYGQRKISETALTKVVVDNGKAEVYDESKGADIFIPNTVRENNSKTNEALLERIRSYILSDEKPLSVFFEKQHYDVFTNPLADKFFSEKQVTEAVVYGVATDYCVKAAVLGMQERGTQTYVVTDAIKGIDEEGTRQALEEMARAGSKLVTTQDVLEGRL